MQKSVNPTFEKVLEDNKVRIYRICRAYAVSPMEPEDLFQEVIIHLWNGYSTFNGRSGISTWVYRIALNVCMRSKDKMENGNGKTVRLESIQFESSISNSDSSQEERHDALYSCIQILQVTKSILSTQCFHLRP